MNCYQKPIVDVPCTSKNANAVICGKLNKNQSKFSAKSQIVTSKNSPNNKKKKFATISKTQVPVNSPASVTESRQFNRKLSDGNSKRKLPRENSLTSIFGCENTSNFKKKIKKSNSFVSSF